MAKKSDKRRRNRSKNKPKARHNVRKLTKENWDIIERIWAEDGLVHFQDKEGRTGWHTVREAALRAQSINLMPYPPHHRPQIQTLVQAIIDACREAQAQREDPRKTKKTTAIINLVDRKNPDGSPVGEPTDEDKQVQAYMFQYFTLDEHDVRAILRDVRLDMPRKKQLMAEVHRQNMSKIDVTPQ